MHRKEPKETCTEGCMPLKRERNRYFTGKYMTKRDFQGEQEYFLSHHRLHNRLMHGWGIVCGLRVKPHRDPACRDRWVIVTPGIAIDCCGREIVVEEETAVKIWDPPEHAQGTEVAGKSRVREEEQRPAYAQEQEQDKPGAKYIQGRQPERDEESDRSRQSFLLCLSYAEEKIEYVPALYAEGECDPTRREANRVREVARLEPRDPADVGEDCWRDEEGDPGRKCRDDCGDETPGPAGACLEPDCPCDGCVPLALITPRVARQRYLIDADAIDTQGRRQLPVPPEFLTHIVEYNWEHGGEMTLSELREGKNGRLVVKFDRKIIPPDGFKTGVSEYTFVVQYGGAQQDIEFLPFDSATPPTLENDCEAVYTIDLDYLRGRRSIAGNSIYVTLKCDFILDCHDNPVDGDHLGGRCPTGNGIKGGVFESWFHVVPDTRRYEEEYDVSS